MYSGCVAHTYIRAPRAPHAPHAYVDHICNSECKGFLGLILDTVAPIRPRRASFLIAWR